jgi:hypothetical protein
MPPVTFDPRVFILPPYTGCPRCGTNDLGILSVGRHRLLRRCRNCMGDSEEALPSISKRVLYLDQFAISNMMKSVDTRAPGHERVREQPEWLELYKRLDVLVRGQVVVCPDFENHRIESIYSRFRPSLEWLYEYLSGGVSFRSSDAVTLRQLSSALSGWLEGRESVFDLGRNTFL